MKELQSTYKEALQWAAIKHKGQEIPGSELPYLVHVTSVAMEVMIAANHTPAFDIELAVCVALLHDTLEDTEASYLELKEKFGGRVADGVLALTKFSNLEKKDQMQNSLQRIKELEKEIWAVKLADRITNLEAPSLNWSSEKRRKYFEGSSFILDELGDANPYLAGRLKEKINEYSIYVVTGEKQGD